MSKKRMLIVIFFILFVITGCGSESTKSTKKDKKDEEVTIVAPAKDVNELKTMMKSLEAQRVSNNLIEFTSSIELDKNTKVTMWIYDDPKLIGTYKAQIKDNNVIIEGFEKELKKLELKDDFYKIALVTDKDNIGYIDVYIDDNGEMLSTSAGLNYRKKKIDEALKNIPDGYTLYSLAVNYNTTYGNSIFPGTIIDLYASISKESIYGKFISNVKVLAVKDSKGEYVFADSSSTFPSVIIFAVPEDIFLLLSKAQHLPGVQIEPVLSSSSNSSDEILVESEEIKSYILFKFMDLDTSN